MEGIASTINHGKIEASLDSLTAWQSTKFFIITFDGMSLICTGTEQNESWPCFPIRNLIVTGFEALFLFDPGTTPSQTASVFS
jgi:hypothetical protein